MAQYRHSVGSTVHRFADLKGLLAAASAERSGDQLAGVAASCAEQRVAARMALADVPLKDFLSHNVIPYEADDVTRLIQDSHDAAAFAPVSAMTVGGLRDWLLDHGTDAPVLAALAPGLTPEMVAAVSKLMRNQDLITISAKIRVVTRFRTTLGLPGCLAARLQPNHPTDDPVGIAASTVDGLLYGMGDAMIGVNPASDNVQDCITLVQMFDEFRQRFDIPTQSCVLSHITTTLRAIERHAPVDLLFQSIGGTQDTNSSFGVSLSLLAEAVAAGNALGRSPGQFMYFETGQGSSLSANAHHGVDQQTLEARAYGVARAFRPFLVNSVVGFIGPEYLYDSKQIIRAGLEDHFCGKLLGVPMGVDACYTNHAEADQDDMDTLMVLLATAGVTFLITVPGGDDVMLNYQTLSYHDVASLRHLLKLRPAPEFEMWMDRMGLHNDLRLTTADAATRRLLMR